MKLRAFGVVIVAGVVCVAPWRSRAEPPASTQASTPHVLSGGPLQTALARTGFSPGLIDGKTGRKTRIAIECFQAAKGLDATGEMNDATAASLREYLTESDADGAWTWTRGYVVTERDIELITGPIPEDWNERAQLSISGYVDALDMLAERGWCSVEMVRQLNPGREFAEVKAGDEVVLPNVNAKALPKLAKVEIDLAEKLVKGFDAEGALVSLMHCSIAREVEKRPVGELKVKVVVTDPDYTFRPEAWPEVDNVFSNLRIAPGPRNPVGLAWIGLDKPGYGMHGTVRPADIGKTGSHGCFRLANWDAVRLAKAVSVGMVVEVRE